MFGKPKPVDTFTRRLIGEWRAETSSGQVSGVIVAVFNPDGSFHTRSEVNGAEGPASHTSQAGRFRVDPIDRERFRLSLFDEEGSETYTSVRSFPDPTTMLTEVGRVKFTRTTPTDSSIFS
ncbi:MAG: hypothetical protein R3C52_05780 [Hyphomonadaceae bacterium]